MSAQDLFGWREEADAAERVAQAEAVRQAAARAVLRAPHGELQSRRARLAEATRAALQAELELARIQARSSAS